jgi:hypothetical protein|nr:MAG TPA: hypothetical protein [Caudoviricetes sp.]
MGAGNFYVRDYDGNECPMVYIDDDDNQFSMVDVMDAIWGLLPKSFYLVNYRPETDWRNYVTNIGQNGLITIDLYVNNDGNYAVVVQVRREHFQDYPDCTQTLNLAKAYLAKFAPKLFDGMSNLFDLRVRCGAWMSGPYQKKEVSA